MRLYHFKSSEHDYVAAGDESEAIRVYCGEYGLSARDMEDVTVSEVTDTDRVEVYPDGWDYDSEEDPPTATEIMAGMKHPGIVCSSNN